MAILALVTSAGSAGNARLATKMAMVKPTPPRMAAPSMCTQFTFSGSEASFVLMTMKLNSMMPMGLPSSKPRNTPKNTGEVIMEAMSPPTNDTSAFVSANSGRMPK